MVLELKNISHSFGGNIILKDVSYSFDEGLIYSILGSNGVGKTTLLNIINGFVKPQKGNLFLKENDITNNSVHTHFGNGVVRFWQNAEVFKNLSLADNLLVTLPSKGENILNYIFNRKEIRNKEKQNIDKVKEILTFLKLEDKKNDNADTLSFGQQKILAFGKLLMNTNVQNGNAVILIDEPFAGIHTDMIDVLYAKIKDFAEKGNCIIIIEHNIKRVKDLSDVVLTLKDYKLI